MSLGRLLKRDYYPILSLRNSTESPWERKRSQYLRGESSGEGDGGEGRSVCRTGGGD